MKHTLLAAICAASLLVLQTTSLAAETGKVVWDYWYTVSVNKIPAEMYNEKAIMHADKIQFMSHVWKKEEGYINEEELGAFAKADSDLTPLFFNFRSNYRTTETIVDGNVKDGNTLVVKVRKAGATLPTVTKSIVPKTFFSVFFPVWLHKVVPSLKEGATVSFSTILEDDIDHGFENESGTVRLEKGDEFSKASNTKKITVDYRSVRSLWYVDAHGTPVRTVMPETNAVIERVSKEKAQAFLK